MKFSELELIPQIQKAIEKQGYTEPTPIQEQAIPELLKGKDLLGCAQTGTGKTAAFSIPIIQHIALDRMRDMKRRKIQSLIVTPTRELAIQIGENIDAYSQFTDVTSTVIFGGVKQHHQTKALNKGVDILVATPGRLLDLINQGFITLRHIKYFVLDEADQMLDMGFIHDIKKLIALLPEKRQSLFFSATMPSSIVSLSKQILGEPHRITIKPEQATAERVDQALYFVNKTNKVKLLVHILNTSEIRSVLVFSRTKHGANKIVKKLDSKGIQSAAIHGNKSQAARQRALKQFKEGDIKVLIATDIAARGIDVSKLSHVINFDIPNVAETYVHRIGRTGRAGESGLAISFCMGEECPYLKDIQKLIKQQIPVIDDHPFPYDPEVEPAPSKKQQRTQRRSTSSKFKGNNSGRSNTSRQHKNRNSNKKRV